MSEGQETSSQQNIISWVRCQFWKTEGRNWTMIQDVYRWIAAFYFFFFSESIGVAHSLPKGLMLLKSTFWKGIATALKCSNFDLGRYLEAFGESFSIQENKSQSPRSPSHISHHVFSFEDLLTMGTVMEERVKKMLGGNLKCEPRDKPDVRLSIWGDSMIFFGNLWILYISLR